VRVKVWGWGPEENAILEVLFLVSPFSVLKHLFELFTVCGGLKLILIVRGRGRIRVKTKVGIRIRVREPAWSSSASSAI